MTYVPYCTSATIIHTTYEEFVHHASSFKKGEEGSVGNSEFSWSVSNTIHCPDNNRNEPFSQSPTIF